MYPGTHARTRPDEPAAIAAASGEVLTWAELDRQSNRLARAFRRRGIGPGGHVALLMENRLEYFVVAWAALRSGVYLTAINRYLTAPEAAYVVADCGARVLIASQRLAPVAEEIRRSGETACEAWIGVGDRGGEGGTGGFEPWEEVLAAEPPEPLPEEPAGGFMLYSSGTTGRPKGILRPLPETAASEGVSPVAPLLEALWGFGPDTVYLSPAPLYHSAPLGFCTATQSLGGTVVMMERFEPEQALAFIERYRATHSQWVPTMFSRMLKLPEEVRARYDLSSLRVAIHAAAPCPEGVKRAMIDWWGPVLYEYYAGTEFNGFTHVSSEEWLARPGTVGRALLGTLHICDESGRELPPRTPGIVYFEQETLPFTYHNDPEKTRSAQHPEHPTWTALGDVGWVDEEGYLYLTDRATYMIISGGVNIYPQEIEDQLVLHPKVADVAVIGVPDPDMGEAVKAVVQPMEGVETGPALERELIEWCRERLAHFKCPRSVDFLDALPRLPTGKLYKRLLRDRYWATREGEGPGSPAPASRIV